MLLTDKIELTKKNIKAAMEDYWRHTNTEKAIKDFMTPDFIDKLAEESVLAKEPLRQMLRKSPAWNEELDALVINGNVTHDTDYDKVWNLALKIFRPKLKNICAFRDGFCYVKDTEEIVTKKYNDFRGYSMEFKNILTALKYFACPDDSERDTEYLAALQTLAPNAYAPGKKISRVFKAFCVALEIADEAPNSDFQRDFAKIADEMAAKKIDFKLYLSINPAHFLTMSNPKGDNRGACLTSCHSFNSINAEYNNGCAGYALDDVTMIAFTASNPDNPETLNNRKTTRQLFMYEPGNGLLLQSRMYNTSGGTIGAQKDSKLYRALVQKQIAFCENAVNYWVTTAYEGNERDVCLDVDGFGGYPDWIYEEYAAMISIRKDSLQSFHNFDIGQPGLCIHCGTETGPSEYILCRDCMREYETRFTCARCHDELNAENSYPVMENGQVVYVCKHCLDAYYEQCSNCSRYFPARETTRMEDENGHTVFVCNECLHNKMKEIIQTAKSETNPAAA